MKMYIGLLLLYIEVLQIKLSRARLYLEILMLKLILLKDEFWVGCYSASADKDESFKVNI